MFDDITPEPEDVFAQTDATAPQITPPTMGAPAAPAPTPMAPAARPVATQSAPAPQISRAEKKAFPVKLVALIVGIIAVIALAFFLSMKILNSRTPVTPKAPSEVVPTVTEPEPVGAPAPTESAPVVTPTPEVVAPVVDLDSDKDGLTDVRETELGTDPMNPDTDSDGLFDKEEVDVYKTNPLNPDTDGDTFKDGDEVKKGYNPNGPGKLLVVPQK